MSRDAADRFHSAAIHALRRVRRDDPASGIGPAQLSALSVLVFGGPRTLGELAAAEQVRPPTMTRIVQALAQAGLVRREGDAHDGRVVRLSATAKGRRVMQTARARRIENLAALLGRLSPTEMEQVRAAAELVERVLGADSAVPPKGRAGSARAAVERPT